MTADVIIIGAGLGGTVSASVLCRAGYDVTLIDARSEYPAEFRAEKFGHQQLALFEKLGLLDVALASVTPHDDIPIARFGRVVTHGETREYGFHYADLVNGLRRALPENLTQIVGRVADIETSDSLQKVTLSDGRVVEGRLLVLSTGLGDAMRSKVGMERVVSSREHSLSFGFTFEAPPKAFPFDSLIFYGSGPRNRIAYMTIFRIGSIMRSNLYVYRSIGEQWAKQFRTNPTATMTAAMPGLDAIAGPLAIKGPIAVRPIDLMATTGYRRPGVALVGDAYATCCPIIGMGIMKVLTDVDQLCSQHIPNWFATPGMSAEKIGMYYDDAVKQACDVKAHHMSVYSRSIVVDQSLVWAARRVRNAAARRAIYGFQGMRNTILGQPKLRRVTS